MAKKKKTSGGHSKKASRPQKKAAIERLPEFRYFKKAPSYLLFCLARETNPETEAFVQRTFQLLERCSTGFVPDYMTFREETVPLLLQPSESLDYQSFSAGAPAEDTLGIVYLYIENLYYAVWLKLFQDASLDEKTQRAIFNRCKLVLSARGDFERALHFHASLNQIPSMASEDLSSLSENATAQDLTVRLSLALQNDRKDDAGRLTGMLQMKKSGLHPGEWEYFSALTYMKDNSPRSLDKARREIGKIPEDAAEYRKAQGMLAEIYARQGDADGFRSLLQKGVDLSPDALLCFLQTLILNLPSIQSFNSQNLTEFLQLIDETYRDLPPQPLGSSSRFRYLSNVLQAASEIYKFHREVGSLPEDCAFPEILQKYGILLKGSAPECWKDLWDAIAHPEKRENFIASYFHPWTLPLDRAQLELWLQAQLDFLEPGEFVDRFLLQQEACRAVFPQEVYISWLTNAYFAAMQAGRPATQALQQQLNDLQPNFQAEREEDVEFHKVMGLITPENRLLYNTAETQYQAAMDSDYGWKDAGMLSLGFFRILEAELRNCTLLRAFGNNHPQVKSLVKAVNAWEKEHELSAEYRLDNNYKLLQTVVYLKKPGKLSMDQMECIFGLLSDSSVYDEIWREGINNLREVLFSVLAPAGVAAAKDNQIAYCIRPEKRVEFRNPPAHGRYLSIDKAGECRAYVNEALQRLHSIWLKPEESLALEKRLAGN